MAKLVKKEDLTKEAAEEAANSQDSKGSEKKKNKSAGKEGDKRTVGPIEGSYFTIQHPGVRWYLKHTDKCRDTQGNLSNEKYVQGLLEACVIQEVSIDDFNNVNSLRELIDEIEFFLGAK